MLYLALLKYYAVTLDLFLRQKYTYLHNMKVNQGLKYLAASQMKMSAHESRLVNSMAKSNLMEDN